MEYQVTVSTVERQPIAVARQRTTFDKIAREIGPLLSHPWALIQATPGLRIMQMFRGGPDHRLKPVPPVHVAPASACGSLHITK